MTNSQQRIQLADLAHADKANLVDIWTRLNGAELQGQPRAAHPGAGLRDPGPQIRRLEAHGPSTDGQIGKSLPARGLNDLDPPLRYRPGTVQFLMGELPPISGNPGGAMVRASGLLDVQSGPLRAPFERHLDVPGHCFCGKTGRLPALHNGLNDIRRQESQADQAAYITALRHHGKDHRREEAWRHDYNHVRPHSNWACRFDASRFGKEIDDCVYLGPHS